MEQTNDLKTAYEQLSAAYNKLLNEANNNTAATRLQFDFAVLENFAMFPKSYVEAVVKDIMKVLPMEGIDVEKELAKPKKKPAKMAAKEE